ncbi:hypothetical protein [Microbacterium gallinarum]|uniref:hypothetical protein n=1 Tax=Microbacterium gallinarum TaxID=2762209 RepID=UPI001CD8AF28|nr:hypothetical protein [Microbacterium gallinarum]
MTSSPIPASELLIGASRTLRFEGEQYGSGISFFYVDNEPGMGRVSTATRTPRRGS